jgi:hypothetical protein
MVEEKAEEAGRCRGEREIGRSWWRRKPKRQVMVQVKAEEARSRKKQKRQAVVEEKRKIDRLWRRRKQKRRVMFEVKEEEASYCSGEQRKHVIFQ